MKCKITKKCMFLVEFFLKPLNTLKKRSSAVSVGNWKLTSEKK